MRDYLATEEESFLNLMFQSYCSFTIAFINTRVFCSPTGITPPPPSPIATPPPKPPGEAEHVPLISPLETQRSCYNSTIAFPSPLNPAPLGLHLVGAPSDFFL